MTPCAGEGDGLHDMANAGVPGNRRESWLGSVLDALHEAVLVFDTAGLVLDMNPAFSDLFGYTMSDGPIVPPYPWWPTEAEDAEQLAAITRRHALARSGVEETSEFLFFDPERNPTWVSCTDATITDDDGAVTAVVRSFRDITGQKQAQSRRAAAARLSADFGGVDDLVGLLSIGEHGFETLFDGGSTTQLDLEERYLFRGDRRITPEELTEGARIGLAGTISADAASLRKGILLVPQTSTTRCRVWVEFARPRRIGPDEMIVADLLAQAFGLAIDRFVTAQKAADREANLNAALDSHRHIGQAVGILVERYRLRPAQAFDRLRQASQHRNLKLRELATRVVETGADPEDA